MKFSKGLVYIQVSRAVDGPQCMCVAVPLCQRFPFFNYWSQIDTSHEPSGYIGTATNRNMCPPFAVWHCPGFGIFHSDLMMLNWLIVPPINEARVPSVQDGAAISPWC